MSGQVWPHVLPKLHGSAYTEHRHVCTVARSKCQLIPDAWRFGYIRLSGSRRRSRTLSPSALAFFRSVWDDPSTLLGGCSYTLVRLGLVDASCGIPERPCSTSTTWRTHINLHAPTLNASPRKCLHLHCRLRSFPSRKEFVIHCDFSCAYSAKDDE